MSLRCFLIITLLIPCIYSIIIAADGPKAIFHDLPAAEIERMVGKGVYPALSPDEIARALDYRFEVTISGFWLSPSIGPIVLGPILRPLSIVSSSPQAFTPGDRLQIITMRLPTARLRLPVKYSTGS